jgi:apolipoprotein N-acyltransferase
MSLVSLTGIAGYVFLFVFTVALIKKNVKGMGVSSLLFVVSVAGWLGASAEKVSEDQPVSEIVEVPADTPLRPSTTKGL